MKHLTLIALVILCSCSNEDPVLHNLQLQQDSLKAQMAKDSIHLVRVEELIVDKGFTFKEADSIVTKIEEKYKD